MAAHLQTQAAQAVQELLVTLVAVAVVLEMAQEELPVALAVFMAVAVAAALHLLSQLALLVRLVLSSLHILQPLHPKAICFSCFKDYHGTY
jgi:hypothetical protein